MSISVVKSVVSECNMQITKVYSGVCPIYSLATYPTINTSCSKVSSIAANSYYVSTKKCAVTFKMNDGTQKNFTFYKYKSGWAPLTDLTGGTTYIKAILVPEATATISNTDKFLATTASTPEPVKPKGTNEEGSPLKDITKSNEFVHLYRSVSVAYRDKDKNRTMFNRMQFANYYNAIAGTREYVFFTMPDLNLLKDKNTLNPKLANDAFWFEMLNNYKQIMLNLNYTVSIASSTNMLIPILTNNLASSLDLPTKTADTTETPSTIYSTTLEYRKTSNKSDEGYDFSLEFTDSAWLDVYHLFKMWDEYSSLKDLGVVSPPGSDNMNSYRCSKILHDQIAIYKFVVDADDLSTIIHYSKLIGCFPKSVPREAFSNLKEGMIQYSVDWHAQFVEDMNPLILFEFDYMMQKALGGKKPSSIKNFIPIWNKTYNEINGEFANYPYVIKVADNRRPSGSAYRLMWLNKYNDDRTNG